MLVNFQARTCFSLKPAKVQVTFERAYLRVLSLSLDPAIDCARAGVYLKLKLNSLIGARAPCHAGWGAGGAGDKSQNKNIIAIEITVALGTVSIRISLARAQNKSRARCEKSPVEFKAGLSRRPYWRYEKKPLLHFCIFAIIFTPRACRIIVCASCVCGPHNTLYVSICAPGLQTG